ncbi:ROK family protein [Candidatus Parcubacteria bacterium]|nr:ROK family protein [Candidatus Parcubacteria bacterium]
MTKKKTYTIGIDIGGTKMNAVLFDGEKVIEDYLLATPKDSIDHFMVMLQALIEPFFERAQNDKAEVNGIGVGVAGVINYAETKVLFSPNIPIMENVEVGKKIEEIFNLPVKINNDVDCFVRAEALLGAGADSNSIYGITIGTGIGGGWCRNGEIYRGHHGGAGEPGEMIIDFDNEITFEKAYHKLMQNNSANMAIEACSGDVLAEKAYLEFGKYLGITLANIVNLINPEIFVIGGGTVKSSDLFLKETKKYMNKYIVSEEAKEVTILKNKIEKHAGAIGATLLF